MPQRWHQGGGVGRVPAGGSRPCLWCFQPLVGRERLAHVGCRSGLPAAFAVVALAVAWTQARSTLGPLNFWNHAEAPISLGHETWTLMGPYYTSHATPWEAAWAFYDYRAGFNQLGARERVDLRGRARRSR